LGRHFIRLQFHRALSGLAGNGKGFSPPGLAFIEAALFTEDLGFGAVIGQGPGLVQGLVQERKGGGGEVEQAKAFGQVDLGMDPPTARRDGLELGQELLAQQARRSQLGPLKLGLLPLRLMMRRLLTLRLFDQESEAIQIRCDLIGGTLRQVARLLGQGDRLGQVSLILLQRSQ
jgi:hypothetical protein